MLKITIPLMMLLTGCTISFSNVSTHGYANDLVDEDQKAEAEVSPDIKVSPIP